MQNFMLFAGANYYPNGGMEDFIGDYATMEDAIAAVKENNESLIGEGYDLLEALRYDWAHVYDIAGGESINLNMDDL